MITCIVTSLGKENLLATPIDNIPLEGLVGRAARYVDKNNKVWPAEVVGIEDQFVVMKFTQDAPTGLGQGQMMDIMEDGDDINNIEQ